MTEWLDADEQRSWRAWLSASVLLKDRLSRELQAAHGLTLADYEILVRLSEADEHMLRMSRLADDTLASRSRLTHQIDRLERDGLVERRQCPSDRRGQLAVLTGAGWDALVVAAPTHVRGVRRHMLDQLTPAQFAALGAACEQVVDAIDKAPLPSATAPATA